MNLNNKRKIFCLCLAIFLSAGIGAWAQETPVLNSADSIETEVIAQDLDVAEPKLLPDNPFYFFKTWQREIKLVFTFNPVKKAEARQQIISEKLLELKALAKKTQDPKILERATASSEDQIEKLKEQIDRFKENAETNPQINKFLDKFSQQSVLHQKILQKLESKVPPQVMEKIQAAREKHLERFGQVMEKLEDKDKIVERINNALEGQDSLTQFRFLSNLEEKMARPEMKEEIKNLQENHLEALKEKLNKMDQGQREKFETYLQEREDNDEMIENIKQKMESGPAKEMLERAKERIMEKRELKVESAVSCGRDQENACPNGYTCLLESNDSGTEGKCVLAKKDNGKIVCSTIGKPVCGENNRTYYNECYAQKANVKIVSKGKCLTISASPLPTIKIAPGQ